MKKHRVKIHAGARSETVLCGEDESLFSLLTRSGYNLRAPCGGVGICGKCGVRVAGDVTPPSKRERELAVSASLRLSCKTFPRGEVEVFLDTEKPPAISLETSGAENSGNLGLAIDIGTTGIAAALYDLATKERLGDTTSENPQTRYGADVLTRIKYSIENNEGLAELSGSLRMSLNEMIERLCPESSDIKHIVIAANTVMLHLLAGVSPKSLGEAPYAPAEVFGREEPAARFGLLCENATVLPLPVLSGFVGGDTAGGILSTGFYRKHKFALLIDIGTNGELAAGSRDGILVCSAAAGPAFEGGNIACGMGAFPGAVCYADLEDGVPVFKTIGGGPAKGICGSGLLDIIAMLRRGGAINSGGRLLPKAETSEVFKERTEDTEDGVIFHISPDVFLTEADVRALQLAKAAIRAGLETLLRKSGKTYGDVLIVYLAGAFGGAIRKESAGAIGLIPRRLIPRTLPVGNSSLAGAAEALLSERRRADVRKISEKTTGVDLSTEPDFTEAYLEAMPF